jgi:hypothetical protein
VNPAEVVVAKYNASIAVRLSHFLEKILSVSGSSLDSFSNGRRIERRQIWRWCPTMKNPESRVTNRDLLIELVKRSASIEAHLFTLFAMQCELLAHLQELPSAPIIEEWSEFRVKLMKEGLADLSEQFNG